jgi:stage V sporulation protein R
MATNKQKERFAELERLALAAGLEPYDVHFFEVPVEIIYEVASYGLPTRYSHWSFGKVYQYQRTQGEMGFSKIYELILNNNPSYAFLDKNNTDTTNLLVAAHCFAHSDFFRNNIMFRECGEESMIQVAKRHADIIDRYRQDYGDNEVDDWLDIALALERHIDIYKGLRRKRYEKRHVAYEERSRKPYEDVAGGESEPLVKKIVRNIHIPPKPEKDILWFLLEYSNLEPWQKQIFEIVRRESYYFYPQFRTKIMNEGWASYWHAELMRQYSFGNKNDLGVEGLQHPLTAEEHLDFLASHEKVVQPGLKIPLKIEYEDVDPMTGKKVKKKGWNPKVSENPNLFRLATRLNPYYVGFRMFRDIKERWDRYYEQGYYEDEWGNRVPVSVNGDQKILQVRAEEDDVSFFRNYLTDELAEELHLFSFGNNEHYRDDYGTQEEILKRYKENEDDHFGSLSIDEQIVENKTYIVRSKELDDIISHFARSRSNYGVPSIVIRRVDEAGLLRLEHVRDESVNVDITYAEHVLRYVHKAWGRPVEMIRKETDDRTWIMRFDGVTFEIDHDTGDYPESVESNNLPSSW